MAWCVVVGVLVMNIAATGASPAVAVQGGGKSVGRTQIIANHGVSEFDTVIAGRRHRSDDVVRRARPVGPEHLPGVGLTTDSQSTDHRESSWHERRAGVKAVDNTLSYALRVVNPAERRQSVSDRRCRRI